MRNVGGIIRDGHFRSQLRTQFERLIDAKLVLTATGTRPHGHSHPEVVMAIRTTRSVGMILLSIWLILYGLTSFVAIPIPPVVSAVIAILAGVLILLGM